MSVSSAKHHLKAARPWRRIGTARCSGRCVTPITIMMAGCSGTGTSFSCAQPNSRIRLLGKSKVCGPGLIATHEVCHYSGDNDYASFVYENLLKTDPELKHLGELHTHPFGMRRLSRGDRKTVGEVLKTYEEFIAGVMLRSGGGIEVYPVYFSREKSQGE